MTANTAFLLVDCQEDYLARNGLQPPRSELVAAIAEALAEARAKGWPVIHVRTFVGADGSGAMPHRQGAPETIEGTSGAQPPDELREAPGEAVLFKRFFSAFDAPGLEEALRSLDVTRLVVAGVHTHACVQASALDAYARGLEVSIAEDLVGSYDPAHARHSLGWLDGRAARVASTAAILGIAPQPWTHRNPCDWDEILGEVELERAESVADKAKRLASAPTLPLPNRAERLRQWHGLLSADREKWVEALVRDVAKPRADAQGEVAYGLALLAHVTDTLENEEAGAGRRVRYRPHGVAGLITPWNNPFAIPVAKLAPALGYGNGALWKPALPGSRIAAMIADSLADCGLGDQVALVTGGADAGRALLGHADLLSFTGSVAVGRQIVAEAGSRFIPVQAELGGSNAAIVDASADLDTAAADLATAMFSFAGQRCTAIRRLVVLDEIHNAFIDRLTTAVAALEVGPPADGATQVGPVLDRTRQQDFLAMARSADGSILAGGDIPASAPEAGCWVAPTLLAGLPADHPLLNREVFGPLAAIIRAADLESALQVHNATGMGLLGALFTTNKAAKRRFLAEAQAGMLSINRARPQFAAEGPFAGWKQSAYGVPEHGRWNRDFYTRAQAIYGD